MINFKYHPDGCLKKENENWVMINNPGGNKINYGFGYMSKGLGEKDYDRSFHPYELHPTK